MAIQYTLAAVHYHLEEFDESARLYGRIAREYDGNAEFYYQAGNAFLRVGDHARVAQLLEQALNFGRPFEGRELAEKTLESIWTGTATRPSSDSS